MQIVDRSIEELIPYVNNSRKHSDEQVAQIAASIKEFGWTNPILVDGDKGIIAGHGRLMAARKLKMDKVPTIELAHLTETQRKALIIADNKLALNADWDNELLAIELNELLADGFALEVLGFNADELQDLLNPVIEKKEFTDPDDVPEIPLEPKSKEGDVYQLGPHRVMCGSSLDINSWDKLMNGERADICWTDPPYNVAYESKLAGKIQNDNMANDEFKQFLLDAYISMFSVMKSGAPIYVAHADTEGLNFRSAFIQAGFKLSGCLIWRKNSLVLGRSDYQWMHEPILYGWKPGSKHRWYGGRKLTTVIDHGEGGPIQKSEDGRWMIKVGDSVLFVSGEATLEESPSSIIFHEKPKRSGEHPTMKPVGLIEKMLKSSARAGDIVIDAFGGSGSTLIAADRLGMSARLMELDPKFVDVIVKRWEDFTGRKAVLLTQTEEVA